MTEPPENPKAGPGFVVLAGLASDMRARPCVNWYRSRDPRSICRRP
jgi:hypothetical protein